MDFIKTVSCFGDYYDLVSCTFSWILWTTGVVLWSFNQSAVNIQFFATALARVNCFVAAIDDPRVYLHSYIVFSLRWCLKATASMEHHP
jgi:hypothetical protein